ncbi:MAG: toprim domain-containing protein [Bacteroidetes bacterium]|nr:toprim domain-containing protein [Bacteroidota bacterium]MBN8703781.1 toprim domain-containing protein [Bacteroidota bacterium]
MDIKDIKQQLPIVKVLQQYHLKIDNNRALCPFHNDKSPSLQIYPETNTYCCFSSNCTAGTGDQIQFIELYEKCTKHEALVKATEMITGNSPAIPLSKVAVLQKIFAYFKNAIPNSPIAKEYIKSRALDYDKLEIGYNTAQFHHGTRKDEYLIKSCLEIGLLQDEGLVSRTGEKAYKPFGKFCIVFPLKNKQGQIVSLYFRSTINDTNQKHYYLKNREGLYPHYPKTETTTLILTESIIDCATLLQNQLPSHCSLLACYGTNGLTTEHMKAIRELKNLKEIIFAFDMDESGKAATLKYAHELKIMNEQLEISRMELPCKDINETAQGHDSSVFEELVNNRTFLFQLKKETQFSEPANILPVTNKLDTRNSEQLHYNTEALQVTLLGGISLQNLDRLRVTIYLRRNPHINATQTIRQNIDLYQDDLVEKFIRKAAEKLDHSTTLISSTIAELTEELEAWRIAQIETKKLTKPVRKELTHEEREAALQMLQQKNLMAWTLEQLQQTGIIGETENAGILFTAMVSRLSADPVSVISLSQSGTGKSYLLEKVAKCFPKEDIIENTQFTDNSFYYWKEGIRGKIILIEDMEGAQNVEYPMRELITKKYITKTVVHKDSKGNLQTVQHRVEGPATFLGCTTKEKIYEDNANRCVLIYLDNSKEQDHNVMNYQKQLRAGIINEVREEQIRENLQNMQRLLQSRKVINPYAPLIDLPESILKPRRSIGILLSFIEAITLYHQYQCTTKDNCLEAHPSHIEWAFKLLKESLFRKSDELSAATRNFLESVKAILQKEKKSSFYMQQIRLALHLHPRTTQRYLYELQQYGYLKIAGGNKYKKGYEYELTELSRDNNLQTTIEKHLEQVMQKIWKAYEEKHKNDSATVVRQNNFVALKHNNGKTLEAVRQ